MTLIPIADRITIQQAAEIVGASKGTVHRWTTVGVRGAKLRVQRLGGQVYTCQAWIDEFIAATNKDEVTP